MPAIKKSAKETSNKEDKSKKTKEDSFAFGGKEIGKDIPKRMTKEEREAIIHQALEAKPTSADKSKYEYTKDETEYIPDKWVVVLTPSGHIYQEPVPRYWDYDTFVCVLASIPDKPMSSASRINFDSTICRTSFNVKDIECYIISVPFDGTRRENTYGDPFNIRNSTKKVGGNIVFAGGENGLNKKQVGEVVNQIIDKLKNYEETIEL